MADTSGTSYQFASDNHNIGNGDFSITDPSSWADAPGNVAKFAAVAAYSGLNSFYNTGVAVANWLGADLEKNDTASALADVDSDLGKYYEAHKQGADMAGFLATSLIPGMAGTKLLQAGQKVLSTAAQTGVVGTNLSRATGLLVPATDMYRSLAAAEIAQGSATFSAITGNTLKAVASGYGQAALESAAFEISVAATMFQSPVLEDSTGWDIAKNIVVGAGVGGVIGGAFTHAATMGSIKKGVASVNPAEKLFTAGDEGIFNLEAKNAITPSQRIIVAESRLESMPSVPSATELLSGKVSPEFAAVQKLVSDLPETERAAAASGMETKFTRLKNEQVEKLQGHIRNNIQQLTIGKDAEFGNQIADIMMNTGTIQATANFEHLAEIGRLGQKLDAEKILNKQSKVLLGLDDDISNLPNVQVGYVKLTGEGVGNLTFDAPALTSLADTSKNVVDVLQKVQSYKFKDGKIWTPMRDNLTHQEVEARGIWVDRHAAVTNGMSIGEHDIPLLEKATALFDTSKQVEGVVPSIKLVSSVDPKISVSINNAQDLFSHLQLAKDEVVDRFLGGVTSKTGRTTEEVAKLANVRQSYLEGEVSSDKFADLFARQSAKDAYVQDLKSKGVWTAEKEADYGLVPQWAKVGYNIKELKDVDGNLLAGMAYVKAKQAAYQETIENVLAKHVPQEFQDRFYHPEDSVLLGANREGAGPGFFSSANANYGSAGAWAESSGSATSDLAKHFKEQTQASIQSSAFKLANKQAAAIEFETVNKKLASSPELYGWNETGDALVPLKLLDYQAEKSAYDAALQAGKQGLKEPVAPSMAEGVAAEIRFTNPEALEAWQTRTNLMGDRTEAFKEIRNAQGYTDMKDSRAARPIRPDLRDYPHFAIVVDPKVTGVGHKSMIHAATPKDLEAMIDKVPSTFQVYKKSQLEQFYKDHGTFDWEQTLHENYIDASLKSNGIDNPFFIKTDPQKIAADFINDHLRSDDIFARELVNAKFEKEFNFLKAQGEQYTSAATSKYTGSYKQVEASAPNPYLNYVKTALNISQSSEHPLWSGLNNLLDTGFTRAMRTVGEAFNSAKTPADLDSVNKLLNQFGIKTAYYDAATNLLANATAPKGELTRFVRGANSILSNLTLRLDPMNSLNNAIGANILYGTETQSVLRAMSKGDSNAVGALADLMKLDIPGLKDTAIRTHGRLVKDSVSNFANPEATNAFGEKLSDFYKRIGVNVSLRDQFHSIFDDLRVLGNEGADTLNAKLSSAMAKAKAFGDFGEKWSGNKLAESFNRFVAADTMRQISDHGVAAGLISREEQIGYINTFVNRTQGNILASQRPLAFQGPIGQAIGLFQSYQFNLMQQMFRHVAEGSPKDTAMLLGLQGTLYGMNGLPAFNAINTHILGTASGNVQHTDAYSSTVGIFGKQVGDLLMYGLPSNLLQANIYTRGDINPRQVTVIPTTLADIPMVGAFTKSLSNISETLQKAGDGGNVWNTFLQGVEHNGISRPLAGLAQIAQGYTTSGKGNISYQNDLFSWGTAARLVGGKPLDEGITNDAAFRFSSYQAVDRARQETLGEAIKTSVMKGDTPTESQIQTFAQKYAATGGDIKNFNKFMLSTIKAANTSQAEKIMEHLKKPGVQNFQQIMGGRDTPNGNVNY